MIIHDRYNINTKCILEHMNAYMDSYNERVFININENKYNEIIIDNEYPIEYEIISDDVTSEIIFALVESGVYPNYIRKDFEYDEREILGLNKPVRLVKVSDYNKGGKVYLIRP